MPLLGDLHLGVRQTKVLATTHPTQLEGGGKGADTSLCVANVFVRERRSHDSELLLPGIDKMQYVRFECPSYFFFFTCFYLLSSAAHHRL